MHPALATARRAALLTALLAASAALARADSVKLHWTAPGSDGMIGRATAYDLRYSPSWITEDNFAQATPAVGLPAPAPGGQPDSCEVWGFIPGFKYCFALRSRDAAGNWSPISNVVVRLIPGVLEGETASLAPTFSPPQPNPAHGATRFAFALSRSGPLRVDVFDVTGRRVRRLADEERPAGQGELAWDLSGADGRPLPQGWYAVRASLPGASFIRRVLIAR